MYVCVYRTSHYIVFNVCDHLQSVYLTHNTHILSRLQFRAATRPCNFPLTLCSLAIAQSLSRVTPLFALAGAAFGAAGQRCMALSVAIFVGESSKWLPELAEKAKSFKVRPTGGLLRLNNSCHSMWCMRVVVVGKP